MRWVRLALGLILAVGAVSGAVSGPAAARTVLTGSPFGVGLTEPVWVLQHLAGLLALGIWAGQNGGAAVWQGPAAVLTAVLGAGLAAHLGVRLPYAGEALGVSLIVAGGLAALALRAPVVAVVLVSALAALIHGYLQEGPWLFWAGYAAGTLLVTAAGVGLSAVLGQGVSPRAAQLCGGAVALAGVLTLVERI